MSGKYYLQNIQLRGNEQRNLRPDTIYAELREPDGRPCMSAMLDQILTAIAERGYDVEGVRVNGLNDPPFPGRSMHVALINYSLNAFCKAEKYRLANIILEGNPAGGRPVKLYANFHAPDGYLEMSVSPLQNVLAAIRDRGLDVEGVEVKPLDPSAARGSSFVNLTRYPREVVPVNESSG